MKMRNLLTFFAIVLLMSATAMAQRTPPAPTTPPTSPALPTPYTLGLDEQVFSFSFNAGGYLGIAPENISKENMSRYGLSEPRGIGITNVSKDSPAERAGLKKGDIILQFNGEPLTSTRKLFRILSEAEPEQRVSLTISRNGSEQQMNVTLGRRAPTSRSFGAGVPPDLNRYYRLDPPDSPRAWGVAPEFSALGFGNNRRIGITTTPLTKQLSDYFGVSGGQGLLISSISENSPASKAGLKAGDVITEVDGERIEDSGDFIRAINKKEEGEVTLTIIRDKSQRTIKVTPEKRTTPSINLTELQAMPMASNLIPLGRSMSLMKLPDVRTLQALPKIESFVMPKMDGLTLPSRLLNLPRVELLQTIPPVL